MKKARKTKKGSKDRKSAEVEVLPPATIDSKAVSQTKAGPTTLSFPLLIEEVGQPAQAAFLEFFTADIRNPNTRSAYARAVTSFFYWLTDHSTALHQVEPALVGAYIEQLTEQHRPATVKQHLAGIRHLFNKLVIRQVIPFNPASSVRGPKQVTRKGHTYVPTLEEAQQLLDAIPADTPIGLRDRALIATMLYTFARVGAAVSMNLGDYFQQGAKCWALTLREKGGKEHVVPAHHKLQEHLDAYLVAAGISADEMANRKREPLFRTAGGRGRGLTGNRMNRRDAYKMVQRRCKAAGLSDRIGCHSWRGFGITNFLQNGGTLEKAQYLAFHASARTTKLYDRTDDEATQDDIELLSSLG